MKKLLALICALAFIGFVFVACGRTNRPERLIAGQWQGNLGPLEFQAMEFTPDEDNPTRGQVSLSLISNLIEGSYEIIGAQRGQPGQLIITYRLGMLSTTREFSFTVDQSTLTLQSETGINLTYTRAD